MLEFARKVLRRVLLVSDEPPHVPAGESPEVFRASPRFLQLLLAEWALMTGVLWLSIGLPAAAAVFAILKEGEVVWLAPVVGVVAGVALGAHAVVSFLTIRLNFDYRWYVLTDRALRIREGIWKVSEVTLTLANVQDIKVSQGPLQRLLGLQDVVVDTAGGGGGGKAEERGLGAHQGMLRGVEVGSALVEKIRSRVQQRRGTGLGDRDEHEHHDANTSFVAALAEVRDEARLLSRAVRR